MNRAFHILAALAFTAWPLACGSSVDSGSSGVTREQACAEVAQVICDQYQKCFPLAVTAAYGDVAKCVERSKITCPSSFDAPKTSITPAFASSCAAALKPQSCTDLQIAPPAACTPPPGGLDDGNACGEDGQCKSTWCAKSDSVNCGVCAKTTASGDACVTVTKSDGTTEKKCSRGLSCAADKCTQAAAAGQACSDAKPCSAGNTCFNAACVPAGKAGAKCDPQNIAEPPCDLAQGVFCNPSSKVCQLFGLADAGQPCGYIAASGDFRICKSGSKCIGAMGATPGTCVAPAADGAACDAVAGPDCVAPAKCIEGRCKLADASSCK